MEIGIGMVENLDYEIQFKIFNKLGIKRTFTGSKVTYYEKLSKLLKEYNIVCDNIHAPFDNINDMWGDDEDAGFCWDTGHESCRGTDIRYMDYFGDRVVALHIHDNRCELDTDDHLLPF